MLSMDEAPANGELFVNAALVPVGTPDTFRLIVPLSPADGTVWML